MREALRSATDEVGAALKSKLADLDVDSLSPREALALLYELAGTAKND